MKRRTNEHWGKKSHTQFANKSKCLGRDNRIFSVFLSVNFTSFYKRVDIDV